MTYACKDCPVPGTCIGKNLPSCTQVKRQHQEQQNKKLEPTDEMVTAFMREFEKWSAVLRYREAEKWHTVDIMGVRHALKAALATQSRI